MDMKDKVAVITGGNRGIGKAISLELSKKGAAVAVNYATNADAADRVVNEILKNKGQAIKVGADISRPDQVEKMFQTVLDHFGRVDILVNNAGTMGKIHLLEISESDWDRVLAVNLKGVFNCDSNISRARRRQNCQFFLGCRKNGRRCRCALCRIQGRRYWTDDGPGHRVCQKKHMGKCNCSRSDQD